MKDEVWKIGKGVLMCFLSRSLNAACLGRAPLSMTNRFPQSLQELFLKAMAQRNSVTLGCMTMKWSTKPLNNFWDVVYHRRGEKLCFSCTLFNYSNKKRGQMKTAPLTERHGVEKNQKKPSLILRFVNCYFQT